MPNVNLSKAHLAANAVIDKKGLEPVLLDVSGEGSYTDFLVIVSARSERQVKAIADHVVEVMSEHGFRLIGQEGRRGARWALVDFGDVVVHIFDHPLRSFYNIEGLWPDGQTLDLQVPPEQRIRPHDDDELGYSLSD